MTAHWDKVAIIGVGMIGGSIGQALLKRQLARQVIGIGRNAQRLQSAAQVGAVTKFTTDLPEGVAAAELTIVCTPVDTIAGLARQVAEHCPEGALITDAGSTKLQIVQAVEHAGPTAAQKFVGSHPIAGSDRAGVEHADADLLEGKVVIVTPGPSTAEAILDRIADFWTALDAQVIRMTPEEHDEALAATSHLPHVIASVLAATTPHQHLHLTGTGWLDTTRVARGDAELWRQIVMQNRTSILSGLRQFAKVLNSFADGLERQEDQTVLELLKAGKHQRDAMAD